MDQTQFNELHANYVIALQAYIASAELSATILAHCTPQPLPLTDRLSLMLQERAESVAHCIYLDLKRVLHDAARSGVPTEDQIAPRNECEGTLAGTNQYGRSPRPCKLN